MAMAWNVPHALDGGLRQTDTDLAHCWRQVGDEDEYISKQESRIDTLIQKCESLETQLQQVLAELKDEIQRVSNETSMVHDYAAGIHHSLVEHGGFLRNGLGLSHQQMVHLATLESQFGNSSSDGFSGIYEKFEKALHF